MKDDDRVIGCLPGETPASIIAGYQALQNARLQAALAAAQARIEKLESALGRFTVACENLHHKRGEYHNSDQPCKAVAAVEKAMQS